MKSFRSLSVALAATLATALSAFAGDPSGVWKFKAELEGRTIESTLTLALKNNQLSGTIDNRAGKADITEGKFTGDELSFTVVRKFGKRLRKKTFTVHYSGKLEGDTIHGTINATGREDKPISVPWTAQRAKP